MSAPSETLPALDQRLAKRLPDYERLGETWPRDHTAIARAEIGRQHEGALTGCAR